MKYLIYVFILLAMNGLLFSDSTDNMWILEGNRPPCFRKLINIGKLNFIKKSIIKNEFIKIMKILNLSEYIKNEDIFIRGPIYSEECAKYKNVSLVYLVSDTKTDSFSDNIFMYFNALTGELIEINNDLPVKFDGNLTQSERRKAAAKWMKKLSSFSRVKDYTKVEYDGYDKTVIFRRVQNGFEYLSDRIYVYSNNDYLLEFSKYEYSDKCEKTTVNISKEQALKIAEEYIKKIPEIYEPEFLELKSAEIKIVNPNFFALKMEVHDSKSAYVICFENMHSYELRHYNAFNIVNIYVDTETGEIIGGYINRFN